MSGLFKFYIRMHEYHLAKSVLESILKKVESENIEKVSSVKLKIGTLKMVSSDSFKNAFFQVAENTLCAGCSLDVEIVDGDTVLVENVQAEYKE